jgi:hypothetical protein
MTAKRMLIGFYLVLSCAALQGQKKELTGKFLLDKINSKDKVDYVYASGFVSHAYTSTVGEPPPSNLAELEKVMKIVKEYLEMHPSRLDESASTLVREAIGKAFPPKKKKLEWCVL